MSTEHQQYSTQNQSVVIRKYAAERGYSIVKTYTDDGKSGLNIAGRDGLQELIKDVESGSAPFSSILVYDISRWGRFQDADESAYYEYVCRRAGMCVIYCAEQFENDGSPTATIIKSVKRAMAGEYSRELSVKVFAGQCRLVELGFRQGGRAGYGWRRMLLDQNGTAKGELRDGERKSLQTDRVVLVQGPPDELATVQRVFNRCCADIPMSVIARELNEDQIPAYRGRQWSGGSVRALLRNEKHTGANIYNRKSFKLKKKHVDNPSEMWIRNNDAFPPIVSREVFLRAQAKLDAIKRNLSSEEVLACLSKLLATYGRLSSQLIDDSGEVSAYQVRRRFGGLGKAYEMVGYFGGRDMEYIEVGKAIDRLKPLVAQTAVAQISNGGGLAVTEHGAQRIAVNGEFSLQISIARYRLSRSGKDYWRVPSAQAIGADIQVAVRMDPTNKHALDYYLLPKALFPNVQLKLGRHNHAAIETFRADGLEALAELAARTTYRTRA